MGVTPGKWGLGGIPLPAGAAPPARRVTSQSGAGVTPGGGPRMTSPAGGLSRGRGSFRRQDVAGPARMLQPRRGGPSPGAHAGGWAHPTRDFILGAECRCGVLNGPPGMGGRGGGDTTLFHAFFLWGFVVVFLREKLQCPQQSRCKREDTRVGDSTGPGGWLKSHPHQNTRGVFFVRFFWVLFAGGDAVSSLRRGGTHGEGALFHADLRGGEGAAVSPTAPQKVGRE